MTITPRKRRVVIGFAIVAIALTGLWVKVACEASSSLEQAKEIEKRGDVELAIVAYRRTVRWYSPFSTSVKTAVDRLWELGEAFESQKKTKKSLLAFRALRSALLGIRSIYQPYKDYLPRTNKKIATLMAQQEAFGAGRKNTEESLAAREAYHSDLLEHDHAPSVFWSVLAVLAFILWCVSLFGLASRGFDDETGTVIKKPALQWTIGAVFTMTVWMVSLGLA
jgi:hypothetical protein